MNCFALNPLPTKRHMTFFREQMKLRLAAKWETSQKKEISMIYLGNIDKKLVMLGGFWLLIKRLRGWRGVGGLVNPLKKKIRHENLFPDNTEWSWKTLCKIISDDIRWCKSYYKTTRNKRCGGCILQIFIRSTFKTWNAMQKGCAFFICFFLVFHTSWYCQLTTAVGGVWVCLTEKIG